MAYFLVKWLEPKRDKGTTSHVLRKDIDADRDPIEVGMTVKAKYVRRYYKADIVEVCEFEETQVVEADVEEIVEEEMQKEEVEQDVVDDMEREEEKDVGHMEKEDEKDVEEMEKEDENDVEEIVEKEVMNDEEENDEYAIFNFDSDDDISLPPDEMERIPKRRKVSVAHIEDETEFEEGVVASSSILRTSNNETHSFMRNLSGLFETFVQQKHSNKDDVIDTLLKRVDALEGKLKRVDALEAEIKELKERAMTETNAQSRLRAPASTHPLPNADDGVYLLGRGQGNVVISNRTYVKCRGATRASELALKLFNCLFSREEMRTSTLSGVRSIGEDRLPLSPGRMQAIFSEVDLVFPNATMKHESAIREAINSKCRHVRYLFRQATLPQQ